MTVMEICFAVLAIVGIWVHIRLINQERNDRLKEKVKLLFNQLKQSDFRIPERSAKTVVWICEAIYGTSVLRQILTSIVLCLAYCAFVIGGVWLFHDGIVKARKDKARIEAAADPWLYSRSEKEFEAANAMHVVPVMTPRREGQIEYRYVYTNHDELSTKIRQHVSEYPRRFSAAVSQQPERESITLVALFEGFRVQPGPLYLAIVSFVLFNAIADFLAFSSVYRPLMWVADKYAAWRVGLVVVFAAIAGSALFIFALLPYAKLIGGSLYIFFTLVIQIPIGICIVLAGLALSVANFLEMRSEGASHPALASIGGLCFAALGGVALWSADPDVLQWEWPQSIDAGRLSWLPYALAASTVVPIAFYLIVVVIVTLMWAGASLFREAALYYLGLVCRMDIPLLVLIFGTPLAVYEFIARIVPLFASSSA